MVGPAKGENRSKRCHQRYVKWGKKQNKTLHRGGGFRFHLLNTYESPTQAVSHFELMQINHCYQPGFGNMNQTAYELQISPPVNVKQMKPSEKVTHLSPQASTDDVLKNK